MRKLSEEELHPSYEEQMVEYRKIFSKDLPPDGNLQDIPPDLFLDIIDFLARQPGEDLWPLIYRYTVGRTKWGKDILAFEEIDKKDIYPC